GSMGELPITAANGFQVVNTSGQVVFNGTLANTPEQGLTTTTAQYQHVYVADFTSFTTPGQYRLLVPGLGTSYPFRIDDAMAANFARAYALGLYHKRCGTDNSMPFTRFVHSACHVLAAEIPNTSA